MGDLTRGIDIDVAVQDIRNQIKMIRRKTDTLIDYYIFPESTPTALAAYDPRLARLDARLGALDKISYTELGAILDDSDALAASYVIDMIVQLLNAIHGINELFITYYDRALEERKPFGTIYGILEFRESQLLETQRAQMTDIRRSKPEDKRDNQLGHLCRGAIQMINNRDRGDIAYVTEQDLLPENRARISRYKGAYLWWKCTSCEFRLRYHLSSSAHSSIHSTQEIREHGPNVKCEYKSAFLVKSHLYQPVKRSSRGNTTSSPSKYACVFCLTQGSKVSFSTGKQLATHIADSHRGKKQPTPLVLEKFNVAIKGQLPERVRRWDLNLT